MSWFETRTTTIIGKQNNLRNAPFCFHLNTSHPNKDTIASANFRLVLVQSLKI